MSRFDEAVECRECHVTMTIGHDFEIPEHLMCWPCASAALEDARMVLAYLVNDGWLDVHFADCPEDDTCKCPIVADINRVLAGYKEPPATQHKEGE